MTRLVRFGGWLAGAGAVAFVVSLFGDATAACTAAESVGQSGGFRLLEVGADGITYTPDGGVNTCTMGFAYVTLHAGFVAVALGVTSILLGVGVRKATRKP